MQAFGWNDGWPAMPNFETLHNLLQLLAVTMGAVRMRVVSFCASYIRLLLLPWLGGFFHTTFECGPLQKGSCGLGLCLSWPSSFA